MALCAERGAGEDNFCIDIYFVCISTLIRWEMWLSMASLGLVWLQERKRKEGEQRK